MRSLKGRVILFAVCLLLVLAGVGGAVWGLRMVLRTEPVRIPVTQGCVATIDRGSAFLTPEQSKWASIIVAESIRRNLPARAATIALATAMQESSLRNIDHGDRDSVGLFQQRPSQGWGSVQQIMDPWYSSGKFYEALVKVPGWQTGDVNDVAQKVQRSGVPDGYRKHVEEARVLASALTGQSPAALSCVVRDGGGAQANLLPQVLDRGLAGKVSIDQQPNAWTITATSPTSAWAAAHLSMANLRDARVTAIQVTGPSGANDWSLNPTEYARWEGAPVQPTTVKLVLG